MTLYQRLLLLAVLPVALLTLLVFGTFDVTSDQKADGVLINLAGRQRMLTQKMTKEVLLLEGARLRGDSESIEELEGVLRVTRTIFDETLTCLFDGGLAPSVLDVSKDAPRVYLKASEGDVRDQLKKVRSIWGDFSSSINAVIKGSSDESDLKAISSGNLPLLKEMNKVVLMLQHDSESKVSLLRWIQGLGIFVGLGIAIRSILISRKINQELVESIIKLNDGAEIVSRSSKVFSGISDDLADGASVQAAGVEETSAAIAEINQKMQDCVRTVHRASEEALRAESSSEIAETSMKQMQEAFSNLEASIEDVVGVIKSIEEIAFQTNILALNAAVEAARAGEAGSGFAVVADEVRSLAQRAANAAHESHGLIAKNHTYTNEGRAIIERATAAMVDLFTLSKSMCRYMNETDGLMQGNGVAIRQVESTIASIDKSIQDMAAGTQQASANSHDLENEVRRLYAVVQGLSRITTISEEDVHINRDHSADVGL